jgi:HPt (histidine-containing phosphotransfer) domain-containing protein
MFRQKGFDDFISKPIDIRRLNAVLNHFVRDKKKSAKYAAREIPEAENTAVSPKLIEVFLRDAEKAILILRDLGKEDMKLFTTTAHAMKSACANVGNEELSEIAKTLEAAGRAEDADFIAANTPQFIEKLQAFTLQMTHQNESDLLPEDAELLKKTLAGIAAACDNYDSDTAEKLLSTLQGYHWHEDTSAALAEISKLLLHAEFEEARDLCFSMKAAD